MITYIFTILEKFYDVKGKRENNFQHFLSKQKILYFFHHFSMT